MEIHRTMESAALILLSLCSVNGFDSRYRCLYFNNTCVTFCPRLMHAYHTRCDKDTVSQRTCEDPLLYPIGFTCGWSRCDCNGDLFLEEHTMQCVALDDCPGPRGPARRRRRRKPTGRRQKRPRGRRISKKIRVPVEDQDLVDRHK